MAIGYKPTLIKCADLLIKRVDLSETCCTHLVDVLADLLLRFTTRPTQILQRKHLPNLRYTVAQLTPHQVLIEPPCHIQPVCIKNTAILQPLNPSPSGINVMFPSLIRQPMPVASWSSNDYTVYSPIYNQHASRIQL